MYYRVISLALTAVVKNDLTGREYITLRTILEALRALRAMRILKTANSVKGE